MNQLSWGQPKILDTGVLAAYVEINVVNAQSIQRLLKSCFGIVLVRVPEFAGDEDLLARNATVLNTLADLVFVAVDPAMDQLLLWEFEMTDFAYSAASM